MVFGTTTIDPDRMAALIVARGTMIDAEKDAKYNEFVWSLVVPATEGDRMEEGPWLGVAVPLGCIDLFGSRCSSGD